MKQKWVQTQNLNNFFLPLGKPAFRASFFFFVGNILFLLALIVCTPVASRGLSLAQGPLCSALDERLSLPQITRQETQKVQRETEVQRGGVERWSPRSTSRSVAELIPLLKTISGLKSSESKQTRQRVSDCPPFYRQGIKAMPRLQSKTCGWPGLATSQGSRAVKL